MNLQRRRIVSALGLASAASLPRLARAEPGITPTAVTFGTTAPFSGALREWGEEYKRGADAYFGQINAQGGVHGRRVQVLYMDDAYEPKRTVENALVLVEQHKVFGLLNLVGTGNTEQLLPHLERLRVPTIGTASGSNTLHPPAVRPKYLFHTKPSYADETDRICEQLDTAGISHIAVVYQNNAFGKAGLTSALAALERRKLQPAATASVETNGLNVPEAVRTIAAAQPKVVVLITAGGVSTQFISAYMATKVDRAQFFGLNIIGSKQLVAELGERSRGIMVSQVVPHPWAGRLSVSREYRSVMERTGHTQFSFVSMEGYINAKLVAHALDRAGPELTREKFVAALETGRDIDLGGYLLRYSPPDHSGRHMVDLTIIGPNGVFVS